MSVTSQFMQFCYPSIVTIAMIDPIPLDDSINRSKQSRSIAIDILGYHSYSSSSLNLSLNKSDLMGKTFLIN